MLLNARTLAAAGFLLLLSGTLIHAAEINEPDLVLEAVGEAWQEKGRIHPALAESLASPVAELSSAVESSAGELQALHEWNAAGNLPPRNGFVRPLPQRIVFDSKVKMADGVTFDTPSGHEAFAARVDVKGAHRLRLRLSDIDLPREADLWVYDTHGEVHHFTVSLRGPDGILWTPSVAGPVVYLDVVVPRSAPRRGSRLVIDQVLEIVEPLQPKTTCLVDASCITPATFDVIDDVRKAIAHLSYVKNGASYICTGGLVNDTDESSVALLLLTANHCVSTQAEASSLEAFWDYRSAFCNGPWPSLGSLARSNGATLLVHGASADYSLLRLRSAPAGRYLLGWDTRPSSLSHGRSLHRISHPLGFAQGYSRAAFHATAGGCGFARNQFHFSFHNFGGAYPGSSGSPVIIDGGYLVGQLYGACGPNVDNGCYYGNGIVDGALSASWPALAPFLDPPPSNPSGPCDQDPETACVQSGRFEVTVTWRTATSNGNAQVQSFGGQRASNNESVFWWFFSPANFEMGVKVLDACALNNHYWVFGSGLTDQGWTVTVRDTLGPGAVKTYSNNIGTLSATFADTAAFPCSVR